MGNTASSRGESVQNRNVSNRRQQRQQQQVLEHQRQELETNQPHLEQQQQQQQQGDKTMTLREELELAKSTQDAPVSNRQQQKVLEQQRKELETKQQQQPDSDTKISLREELELAKTKQNDPVSSQQQQKVLEQQRKELETKQQQQQQQQENTQISLREELELAKTMQNDPVSSQQQQKSLEQQRKELETKQQQQQEQQDTKMSLREELELAKTMQNDPVSTEQQQRVLEQQRKGPETKQQHQDTNISLREVLELAKTMPDDPVFSQQQERVSGQQHQERETKQPQQQQRDTSMSLREELELAKMTLNYPALHRQQEKVLEQQRTEPKPQQQQHKQQQRFDTRVSLREELEAVKLMQNGPVSSRQQEKVDTNNLMNSREKAEMLKLLHIMPDADIQNDHEMVTVAVMKPMVSSESSTPATTTTTTTLAPTPAMKSTKDTQDAPTTDDTFESSFVTHTDADNPAATPRQPQHQVGTLRDDMIADKIANFGGLGTATIRSTLSSCEQYDATGPFAGGSHPLDMSTGDFSSDYSERHVAIMSLTNGDDTTFSCCEDDDIIEILESRQQYPDAKAAATSDRFAPPSPPTSSRDTYDSMVLSKSLQAGSVVNHFENRGAASDDEEGGQIQRAEPAPAARRAEDTPLPVPQMLGSMNSCAVSVLSSGGVSSTYSVDAASNNDAAVKNELRSLASGGALPGAYRRRPGGHSSEALYFRDDYAVVVGDNTFSDRALRLTKTKSKESMKDIPAYQNRRSSSDIVKQNGASIEEDDIEKAKQAGLAVAMPVKEDGETADNMVQAEELDPNAPKKIAPRTRRIRRFGTLAVFVVVVLVIGISIIVTLMPQAKDDVVYIDGPTPAPTTVRETIGIRDTIMKVVGPDVLKVDELSTSLSSYANALDWITNDDPQQLTADDPSLIQRFIAAYLYFSMTAKSSSKSLPFCSPPPDPWSDSTDCMWRQVRDYATPRMYDNVEKSAWLSNTSECAWGGIRCSSEQQIIALDLNDVLWEGMFPGGVRHLPFLQKFSCAANKLTGTIPKGFMLSLRHITEFQLDYNAFTGSVPTDWWEARRLRQFSVGANKLSGSIPSTVGNLADVKTFILWSNNFTNAIPEEIGNMNSVNDFNCAENNFQGNVPKSLKNWNQLFSFDIESNNFTGQLPFHFYQEVGFLFMGNNRFTGTIPEAIYSLPRLQTLDLSDNFLTGSLSSSIGRLSSKLFHMLHLSDNNLNGTIPDEIKNLNEISFVYLQGNDFTGSIPDNFCALQGGTVLAVLEADCRVDEKTGLAQLYCADSCCTRCCNAAGKNCEQKNWNPNQPQPGDVGGRRLGVPFRSSR